MSTKAIHMPPGVCCAKATCQPAHASHAAIQLTLVAWAKRAWGQEVAAGGQQQASKGRKSRQHEREVFNLSLTSPSQTSTVVSKARPIPVQPAVHAQPSVQCRLPPSVRQ